MAGIYDNVLHGMSLVENMGDASETIEKYTTSMAYLQRFL